MWRGALNGRPSPWARYVAAGGPGFTGSRDLPPAHEGPVPPGAVIKTDDDGPGDRTPFATAPPGRINPTPQHYMELTSNGSPAAAAAAVPVDLRGWA